MNGVQGLGCLYRGIYADYTRSVIGFYFGLLVFSSSDSHHGLSIYPKP